MIGIQKSIRNGAQLRLRAVFIFCVFPVSLEGLLCSVGAGDTAEGEDVGDGVAAQTVAGMHAAGDLARGPQAFDDAGKTCAG